MNEKVPQCQIVMFFASKKSVFNSIDCAHELDLARKHEIQIIPIKGEDVSWEELGKIDLSRQLGHEYKPEEFDSFKVDIFNYIMKLKKDVNLFDTAEAKIDTEKLNIMNTLNSLFESKEFRKNIFENLKQLQGIFKELNAHEITPLEYFFKSAQILSKISEEKIAIENESESESVITTENERESESVITTENEREKTMAEYKLSPVKKIFSKRVVTNDGASKEVLELSEQLGMLSKEELDILVKLKEGGKINLSKEGTDKIIQSLLKKELIVKI